MVQTNLLCIDCVKAMWQGWEGSKFLALLQFTELVDFEYINLHGNKDRFTMPKGAFVGDYLEDYVFPGAIISVELNGNNQAFLPQSEILEKLIEYSGVLKNTAILLSKWV